MRKPLVTFAGVIAALFGFATFADAAPKKAKPAKEPSAKTRSAVPKAGNKPASQGTIVKSKSNITNN